MGCPLLSTIDALRQRASAGWPTTALAREDVLAHQRTRDATRALRAADHSLVLLERRHLPAARQGQAADVVAGSEPRGPPRSPLDRSVRGLLRQ